MEEKARIGYNTYLGSFRRCRYARFCACTFADNCALESPGVLTTDSPEARDSRPIIEVAVTGVNGWNEDGLTDGRGGIPIG